MNKQKRILIIGLTERMGGVETFIYNTTIFSDKSKYKYDYLVHGSDHCVFQKEIEKFYHDDEQHFFFVRKYKENPIGCISDLKKFYAENGYKYDYIHFQSGSTAEILYVYPLCKKYRIKVICHSHNGSFSPTLSQTQNRCFFCLFLAFLTAFIYALIDKLFHDFAHFTHPCFIGVPIMLDSRGYTLNSHGRPKITGVQELLDLFLCPFHNIRNIMDRKTSFE